MADLGTRHIPLGDLLHKQRHGMGRVQRTAPPVIIQFIADAFDNGGLQNLEGILLDLTQPPEHILTIRGLLLEKVSLTTPFSQEAAFALVHANPLSGAELTTIAFVHSPRHVSFTKPS